MSRWEHAAVLERMTAAVAAHPEKLAARKTRIEHCWGTLKWLLPGGFLVRGKVQVGAEVSQAHFGYNLKRALAVVGLEKLLAALQEGKPRPGGGVVQATLGSVASALKVAIQGCQRGAQSWRKHLRHVQQVSSATA